MGICWEDSLHDEFMCTISNQLVETHHTFIHIKIKKSNLHQSELLFVLTFIDILRRRE